MLCLNTMTSMINTNATFFDFLELVSILLLDDPVMGVSDLTMTAKEMHRCRKARYVKSVLMIHVGGTRCVPSSTANMMNIQARITLNVEFIQTCIFLFLLYV